MIRTENDIEVYVSIWLVEYYNWCRDNLKSDTWFYMDGPSWISFRYVFNNPEDATMFKLRFEL